MNKLISFNLEVAPSDLSVHPLSLGERVPEGQVRETVMAPQFSLFRAAIVAMTVTCITLVFITACSRKNESATAAGGMAITHYSDVAELFVEFPVLIKGNEVGFAAHTTRLGDPLSPALPGFKAITEGKMTVMLSGGGQPQESAEALPSATPGIFRPVLKLQYAGKRRLVFQLQTPGFTSIHDLGEIEVYPDQKTANANAKPEGEDHGIKFPKEQQWKIDFANIPVSEREIRESINVTAMLRPRASGEAQLAAPSMGLLRAGPQGFPQVGMKVAAGQVLAYLVPKLGGETDAATLQLALQRARIELNEAQHERERLENLFRMEAIPEKRLIEARNQEHLAQAELNAAEQRIATYQGGSGGIAFKSPIAGTVVAVNATSGAVVSEGQTVIHIAALDKLWLEARIPESDLGRVTKPSGAFFRLEGAERATILEVGKNARLIAMGGLVDKDTRTVPAILEFDNKEGVLRAGMTLRAQLYTGRVTRSIAIPASAVVDDNGQSVAFVQKEGESFERRVLELGARDGDWVAVKSGLAKDERIVTKGAYQVRLAATAPAALGHGHAH